jgi:Txe/YoeB family toxin of Txe-Axe toxin-antitoxin module
LVTDYAEFYEERFHRNLSRYPQLRERLARLTRRIAHDPYHNSEPLGVQPGGLDLRGCRSFRIDRNFRIVFVVCEECRRIPACRYCYCEGLSDKSVVFLTFGPHRLAYAMK